MKEKLWAHINVCLFFRCGGAQELSLYNDRKLKADKDGWREIVEHKNEWDKVKNPGFGISYKEVKRGSPE